MYQLNNLKNPNPPVNVPAEEPQEPNHPLDIPVEGPGEPEGPQQPVNIPVGEAEPPQEPNNPIHCQNNHPCQWQISVKLVSFQT